jgi:hypothetical protein
MRIHNNPFQDLSPPGIYDLLIDPYNDLPVWPSKEIQAGYTATNGPTAVKQTQYFIDMLDEHGAFTPGWRGLDYGAGWGRIAALLLAKGDPEQLDLVDAWDRSLKLLDDGAYRNRCWKVSEILQPGDLPEKEYDFVYAFSVFTHLAPRAFWTNLDALAKSIRSPGTVYFTVRHLEFAKHKYPEKMNEISAALESEGFWFTSTFSKPGVEPIFGSAVVSEKHLRDTLGPVEYLGQPSGQMQHVYALKT